MDVKVMAFELTLGKGISITDFYNYCRNTSGTPIYKRFIYVDQSEKWLRGIVLTSKDIKAFTKLVRKPGKIMISPEAINDGELAHFNFFILNTENLRGYFQYYHGSTSIHSFGDTLKRKYRDLKHILIDQACKKAEISQYEIPKSIRNKYDEYLKFEVVLLRKTFKEFMKEFTRVKNITVQFKEYIPNQPLFRVLAEKAKTRRHTLTFKGYEHRIEILNDVIALGTADVVQDLHGVGVTDDNFDRPFKLHNEPETLDHFDFNEFVLLTEFDSSNVKGSIDNAPVVKRLFNITEKDKWINPNS
ncbi:MAG: hypothetical protein CVU71_00965 [Deltaproteobacteria bacterium HGW-Deltaproteobacteria-6]|jgi:hypothetical protein|nr:MAG: hypothetical protein CVU71_00965 [Deltaproteobacteria bacterium HGW-Deltaproteobacteria-6]